MNVEKGGDIDAALHYGYIYEVCIHSNIHSISDKHQNILTEMLVEGIANIRVVLTHKRRNAKYSRFANITFGRSGRNKEIWGNFGYLILLLLLFSH